MTPAEVRAVLIRDAAELLGCDLAEAERHVTAIAERHRHMPCPTLGEWVAAHLGAEHPAAQPQFVAAICRRLDDAVVV